MLRTNRFYSFVKDNALILGFAFIKLLIHIFTNGNYALHRDEFLYLAQGLNPGWGYIEVPPAIGTIAWLIRFVGVDTTMGIRLFPSLLGSGMVLLVGLMVKEMRGGKIAQILACTAMLVSPAMLRTSWMFQPVIINVFFWTLFGWLLLRYINTERVRYIYFLGIAVGLGFLNKYSVAFYLMAFVPVLLFSRWRVLLGNRHFYISLGIALLIFSPNLIWQWQHNMPVILHMKELQETQLVNVSQVNFLLDQFVLNLPAVFVWIIGAIWLMFGKRAKKYRLFVVHFIFLLLILMVLRGKSYYTIGVYPLLFAAGGVALEAWSRKWFSVVWIGIMLAISLPVLPLSLPLLKGDKLEVFFKSMVDTYHLDFGVRWEDGKVHPIPQDYADMMGWQELAHKVEIAWNDLSEKEKQGCVIYAGNYGEAGAIAWYNRNEELPQVVSFNSSFALWAPYEFKGNTLIYVDWTVDHLKQYFGSVEKVGGIATPLAREYGVGIYVCREPTPDFYIFYELKVYEVKSQFGLSTP